MRHLPQLLLRQAPVYRRRRRHGLTWLLSLWLGGCLAGAAHAETREIDIADGDFESLQNALCDAALGHFEQTVIRLAERGSYTPTRRSGSRPARWLACQYGGRAGNIPLSPGAGTVFSDVVIEGNNATLDFEGGSGFSVADGGSLYLEAVELRNSRWALVVDGRAELERVTVIYAWPEFPGDRAPIHNRGELLMRSTVVAANRLLHVPADLLTAMASLDECPETASAGILNQGSLVANNVTLYGNHWDYVDLADAPTGSCVTRDLINLPGADAWISNSIVASGLFANCAGTVRSRGYNSVPEGDRCGFAGLEDTVESSEGVFPYVPHEEVRQMDRQLFLPDRERLQAGNPEVPGSSSSACEILDVRGHVRGVKEGHCDRGALDLHAAPALDSALDGLWFDPDNDGQYLQIAHYGRDRALLTWHSFDAGGGPIWVYGSAVYTEGNRVQADAYRNSGVRLVDGQLQGKVEAALWGELTVESLSCDQIRFRYETANGGAGNTVDALLKRLTGNPVADCSD